MAPHDAGRSGSPPGSGPPNNNPPGSGSPPDSVPPTSNPTSSNPPDSNPPRNPHVPLRRVPNIPWGRAALLMAALFLAALGGWEAHWRSEGFRPTTRNSESLWAATRRRVDRAELRQTVLLGSSRMLFDIDLDAWEEETGVLPVQLALEGTNPRPVLKGLAQDPDFTGLALVGVTPVLFIQPDAGYRAKAIARYGHESPSQWLGQQISAPLERVFAFYHFDTALFAVLHRQTWWPARPGLPFQEREVRRLTDMDPRREANLWWKVDDDPEYAALAQSIWSDFLDHPPPPPPEEEAKKQFEELLGAVRADVDAIRARGGEVAFVRLPSAGHFREVEAAAFPRESVWEPIMAAARAVAIHFEDYPQLSNVRVPEWSHVSARDKGRLTRALVRILREKFEARGVSRPELQPEAQPQLQPDPQPKQNPEPQPKLQL